MSDETLLKRCVTAETTADDRRNPPPEQAARIHELAKLGWKPRDIASVLSVHPAIVIRELERTRAA